MPYNCITLPYSSGPPSTGQMMCAWLFYPDGETGEAYYSVFSQANGDPLYGTGPDWTWDYYYTFNNPDPGGWDNLQDYPDGTGGPASISWDKEDLSDMDLEIWSHGDASSNNQVRIGYAVVEFW